MPSTRPSTGRANGWLAPWRYPLLNHSGQSVPREEAQAHAGPYVAGDPSTVLLPGPAGDAEARRLLERATSPAETFALLNQLFPDDRHLGGPVDYGLYLVGRMVAERHNDEFGVPDFNLDSDRGYAYPPVDFHYRQACTPPHFFHAAHDNPRHLQSNDPNAWRSHSTSATRTPSSGPTRTSSSSPSDASTRRAKGIERDARTSCRTC
jgi:hypothetical protein